MSERAPLLVTGSHRSGTTWVGKMLALSADLGYINEPFNVKINHSITTDKWFTYICEKREAQHHSELSRILSFRYPLLRAAGDIHSLREIPQLLQDAGRWTLNRLKGRTPLVKDPIALLSAERLAETYDFDVIVMIRHPAGFAGSLKKQGWTFPFEDLLHQSDLMNAYFTDYVKEIESFVERRRDIVDQASLLWKLLYSVVVEYQERHPEWRFLRHEDVARQPRDAFRTLYEDLGLDFSTRIEKQIDSYSDPSRQERQEESIRRDSQATIRNWERRLTEAEIRRVRKNTETVAATFYGDQDW